MQTKGKLPRLPFVSMKDAILGKSYELSIAFVNPKKAQEINKTYRDKDYVPNVLSFPLTEKSGEIFICKSVVRKTAREHNYTYENFLGFLVIHGMLHLKGYDHGSTMESLEDKWKKHFSVFEREETTKKKNSNRN